MVFCISCSFTDNSTKLAYRLKTASKKLKSKKDGEEFIINYKPEDSKAPFTILILSKEGATSEELYQKGLDPYIIENLFGLKKGAAIVVYQNGKMSNTSYHLRFVDVAATHILKSSGNTDFVVKKIGVDLGHSTNKVVLVELSSLIDKLK